MGDIILIDDEDEDVTAPKPLTRAELVQRMQQVTEKAVTEALSEFTPQDIVRQVQQDMVRCRTEVALKVLGLDNRWGKWEVDHCNGRMSTLSQMVSEQASEHMRQMVKELIDETIKQDGPKIRTALKQVVKSVLTDVTRYGGRDTIRRMADTYVTDVAKEVFNEATGRDGGA